MIIAVLADHALHRSLAHGHGGCPGDDVNTDPGPESGDGVEDTPGDTGAVHPEAAHTKEGVEDETLPEAGTRITSCHGVRKEAEAQG